MSSKPILSIALIALSGVASIRAEQPTLAGAGWPGHLELLNELSERRRSDPLFVNEQGAEAQVAHVNLPRGNLTFLRRDLVTVGRVPIVAGRVYDSASAGSVDFGPGWRLTFDERIEPADRPGRWLYFDETGSETVLTLASGRWSWDRGQLASIDGLEDRLTLTLATGWTKTFTRISGSYRLSRVADPSDRGLVLEYRHGLLARVSNDSERGVELIRRADGRVVELRDDQGRSVSFTYDTGGLLTSSADLGGFPWRYTYEDGKLTDLIDPLGNAILQAEHGPAGRAVQIQVRGLHHEYSYSNRETKVTDAKARETIFRFDDGGSLVSVLNPLGVLSELRRSSPAAAEAVLVRDGAVQAPGREGAALDRGKSALDIGVAPIGLASPSSGAAGGEPTVLSYDKDGQILRAIGASGEIELEYDAVGKLIVARLAGGEEYRYRYDARGLRVAAETPRRSYDYRYDDAGRLEGIRWESDDKSGGYDYVLDSAGRVVGIVPVQGVRIDIEYDGGGNVVRYDDTVYTYDVLDRLVGVADATGLELSRSYQPDEPGPIAAADDRTAIRRSGAAKVSGVYGTLAEIFHSRTAGSSAGGTYYDPQTKTLRLLGEAAAAIEEPPLQAGLRRTQLDRLMLGDSSTFNAGSNAFFLPPEVRAIGCSIACNVTGLITTIDGSASATVRVTAGAAVPINAVAAFDCGEGIPPTYLFDFTGDNIWDYQVFEHPVATVFFAYPPGVHQTQILAGCPCWGSLALTTTTVIAEEVTVSEREVRTSRSKVMSGQYLNSSGNAAVTVTFLNTLHDVYTVKETFRNGELSSRQILTGVSTLTTQPGSGTFPSTLPYTGIAVLNARHRFESPSPTSWVQMAPPAGPSMLPPLAVARKATTPALFPVGNTGVSYAEVQALGLSGHPGGSVSFAVPSPLFPWVFAGPNGLLNDTITNPLGF